MDANEILNLLLTNAAFKEPLSKLATPICEKAGQTLGDLWEIAFGGIHEYVKRKDIERAVALENYRNRLAQNILKISPENICEPQIFVIGPALEASKYYFENEAICNMFAQLIASSFDCTKQEYIHPSFVEIIKQLSPIDAQMLNFVVNSKGMNVPIVKYCLNRKGGSQKEKYNEVYVDNVAIVDFTDDILSVSRSIDSLVRNSLLATEYPCPMLPKGIYEKFEHTHIYNDHQTYVSENPDMFDSVSIDKGILHFTNFGKAFYEVCTDEKL